MVPVGVRVVAARRGVVSVGTVAACLLIRAGMSSVCVRVCLRYGSGAPRRGRGSPSSSASLLPEYVSRATRPEPLRLATSPEGGGRPRRVPHFCPSMSRGLLLRARPLGGRGSVPEGRGSGASCSRGSPPRSKGSPPSPRGARIGGVIYGGGGPLRASPRLLARVLLAFVPVGSSRALFHPSASTPRERRAPRSTSADSATCSSSATRGDSGEPTAPPRS